MYEEHWNLTQSPFRPHCGAEFFCRTPGHHAALLKLRYVLEHRQASAALIGPTGIGKSLLIRHLESDLPETIGPVIWLSFPEISPLELVRYLVTELSSGDSGAMISTGGMDEWLHAWEASLFRCRDEHRLPVIVVDDAQVIENRTIWQTWQLLLTYRERAGIDFSVLFVGQPELLGRLERFPQLEERLALVCTLPPLSESETRSYITHRLEVAGAQEPIFEFDAMRRLWEISEGIPRRIDRLCDFSLLVGFADGLSTISADQIDAVAQELHGRKAA